MLLAPLPNFLFQRDPSCRIYDGVTINPMTKPARKPETMIMETLYRFSPMFAAEKSPVWLGESEDDWGRCHVEGGDVQPIGNGTVMIGMDERTTPQAVLWIARSLFRAGSARQVLAVHLPKSRSCMHLDTVITVCDRDLVTFVPCGRARAASANRDRSAQFTHARVRNLWRAEGRIRVRHLISGGTGTSVGTAYRTWVSETTWLAVFPVAAAVAGERGPREEGKYYG